MLRDNGAGCAASPQVAPMFRYEISAVWSADAACRESGVQRADRLKMSDLASAQISRTATDTNTLSNRARQV